MNASIVRWLGQTASPDLVAWEAYIKALRNSLQTSWNNARSAYLTLKSVREQLGLPFIVNPGSPEVGNAPGMSTSAAWQSDLDQQAVNVMGMVTLSTNALDDAVLPAGNPKKRNLVWDATRNDFGIEALPGDLLRLEARQAPSGQTIPVLVDANTNQPTNIQGTISAVPALLIAAGVVVTVVQTIGLVLIVNAACETLQTVAEQKTLQTITEKQAELVQSGKATPEQAASMSKAVFSGAAELEKSKAAEAEAKSKPTSDITKTITTVALVALGLGVIYAVVRLVPPIERRRTLALALPASA